MGLSLLIMAWTVEALGEGLPAVVDFEDVAVEGPAVEAYTGPGGGVYYNGSDGAGGFSSVGVYFENAYNADWMSWSGWAYSTTTDVETAGFGNQYSSYAGGAASGEVYAVTYAPSVVRLPAGMRAPMRVSVSMTTYAAKAILEGDAFTRPFGDDPATEGIVETDYPDVFTLTITGYAADGSALGSVETVLADYRGPAETDGVLEGWTEVNLGPIAQSGWGQRQSVAELGFSLESTDVGAFGMNTPAYVAVDDLVIEPTLVWGPYDLGPFYASFPAVDTGDFLGWVTPHEPYVYVYDLARWVYLDPAQLEEDGVWMYVPRGQ